MTNTVARLDAQMLERMPVPVLEPEGPEVTTPRKIWNRTKFAAEYTLYGAEVLGEKLAGFFGLSDYRYQDVMDEYKKNKDEEKLKEEQDAQEITFVEEGGNVQYENVAVHQMNTVEPAIHEENNNNDTANSNITNPVN